MEELVRLKWGNNDHIVTLTLNRPNAANAMSIQLLDELNRCLAKIQEHPKVRCLIITGSGNKAFCAGADLKERKMMTEDEVIQTVRYIGQTVNNVEKMPIPVIAAINGAAFGGGLELALACDLRITSSQAKMGLTETSLAIIPGAGGTQRLPRLIGVGQAKRLIFTAAKISAEEAKQIGLVEEVVHEEHLLDTVIKLAKQIAENAPIAIKQAKQAIDLGLKTDIATGIELEHICYKETIHTDDRREGLQAFSEKRKPVYEGK